MTLFQYEANDGTLLLITAASAGQVVGLINEASDDGEEVDPRKLLSVQQMLMLRPDVLYGKPIWAVAEGEIITYLTEAEVEVTPDVLRCLGRRVVYENSHCDDADEQLGGSDARRQVLLEQAKDLPPMTLAFDSNGHLHGLVGYTRAMKDPEHWEARGNPEGYWCNWSTWKAWLVEGNGPGVVDSWSFRRAANAPPLTHEELNA